MTILSLSWTRHARAAAEQQLELRAFIPLLRSSALQPKRHQVYIVVVSRKQVKYSGVQARAVLITVRDSSSLVVYRLQQ